MNVATAGIAIRDLKPTDAGLYRALMLRGYTEHPDAFASTFEERATKPIDWWSKRLQDPTSVTLGAFDAGDSLIGTLRLEQYQRARERHKVDLAAVYVMRDFASKGVGRRLIEEALVAARKLGGIENLSLTVTSENLAALRLFAKIGFQEFGREKRAIKAEAAYYDRLYMWRPVSADYVAPI
jgi:ribosomal protein S18 acetylase RimI-like enzyme